MAPVGRDVVDVLDAEGVQKVVGIGHDCHTTSTRTSRAQTGSDWHGYWMFFARDDAHLKIEKNLVYPQSPDVWYEWLSPVGKTEEWIAANRTPGLPSWLSQEEYDTKRANLEKSGIKSQLNFYKAAVNNLSVEDDKQIPVEAYTIRKPALFIAATRDSACTAEHGKLSMKQYVPEAKIVELNTGHWVQMEATDRVNAVLDAWLEGLKLAA
ncbi:Alpha/Beta hydrolase protein [Trametes elegans]|nr:Alpha/Beta hydrolase protein [Trametes elegans]